jgi:trehalose 6-phosphate phosphatase
MSAPRHAFDCWEEIARRIRRAAYLSLFTDFDGTLVPIRKQPDRVSLSHRLRRLLQGIAGSGVTLGVVSGRKIDDLRQRVGLRHIWYVGVHGYFLRDPGNRSIVLLSPSKRERMKELAGALAHRLNGLPGIRIEPKAATIAVHFRGAPLRSASLARRAITALQRSFPSAFLLCGKKVWEWLPDSHIDKWTALSLILRRERNGRRGRGRLAIFLGDDTTDERVFRKMKGISIVVGTKGRTAARYYLRSPAEVKKFFALLQQARQ